jgi:hypothetical protein
MRRRNREEAGRGKGCENGQQKKETVHNKGNTRRRKKRNEDKKG